MLAAVSTMGSTELLSTSLHPVHFGLLMMAVEMIPAQQTHSVNTSLLLSECKLSWHGVVTDIRH